MKTKAVQPLSSVPNDIVVWNNPSRLVSLDWALGSLSTLASTLGNGRGGRRKSQLALSGRNPWPPFGLLQGTSAAPPRCHIAPFHPFLPEVRCSKWGAKVREAHPLASPGVAHWGRQLPSEELRHRVGRSFDLYVQVDRLSRDDRRRLLLRQPWPSSRIFHVAEAAQHVDLVSNSKQALQLFENIKIPPPRPTN